MDLYYRSYDSIKLLLMKYSVSESPKVLLCEVYRHTELDLWTEPQKPRAVVVFFKILQNPRDDHCVRTKELQQCRLDKPRLPHSSRTSKRSQLSEPSSDMKCEHHRPCCRILICEDAIVGFPQFLGAFMEADEVIWPPNQLLRS